MSTLGVETTHSKYQELEKKWAKTRAVGAGEDEVHDAGTLLLPMLEQQALGGEEGALMYTRYKDRARFLPAFSRTLQGLAGTVTRKDPIFKVEPIEDLVSNIDGSGTTLKEYSKQVLDEMLEIGYCGTLVDHVPVDDTLTVAEAEASNLRPSFAFYKAENIINWKYDTVNNINVLVMIVLEETVTKWVTDFQTEEVTQYRVLRLSQPVYDEADETVDPEDIPFIYTVQLYTRDSANGSLEAQEPTTPLIGGEALDHIPFFWHGEVGEAPPLYDLVTTNVKHYQLKADHNHALHYIGLPTPIFPGVDPLDPNKPRCIGPEQIVYLSNVQAKPFYLTYGGEGLNSVEKELTEIEKHMAFLGANMLAPNENVQETATKASIRRASETSALSLISEKESESLTEALQFFALWYGVEETTAKEEVSVEMSKDFDPNVLTAQDLLALVQSWQQGAFSKQTLFWNLQQGEIISGEKQFEDEEEEIQNEMPAAGNNPFNQADDDPDDGEEEDDEEQEEAEKEADDEEEDEEK